MKTKVYFNGTPAMFGVFAQEFDPNVIVDGDRIGMPYHRGNLRPDANPVSVTYYSGDEDPWNCSVLINTHLVRENKSILKVQISDEYPSGQEFWGHFRTELENEGLVDKIIIFRGRKGLPLADNGIDFPIEKFIAKNPQLKTGDDSAAGYPWGDTEIIDKTGWDLMCIKLWREGLEGPEIASRCNVTKGRVYNRLSELRKFYGAQVVPRRKDRNSILLRKS